MSIVGLITEYNPFHNGHLYHIEKAKEVSGADTVIVVMSGDYVQRGTPAFLPKHIRAKMALDAGADMVLELPLSYATASAEIFALGAVSILSDLNVVDTLCFGSESADTKSLLHASDILCEESFEFKTLLQKELRKGYSFPAAREAAFLALTKDSSLCHTIATPNNILGIEYIKAIKALNNRLVPLAIKRISSTYHDTNLTGNISSATAIRLLFSKENFSDITSVLSTQVPDFALHSLRDNFKKRYPVFFDDFSLLLKDKLLQHTKDSLLELLDITPDLAAKIIKHQNQYISASQFSNLLKSKNLTHTRINRSLLHILLSIKKTDVFTKTGAIKKPTTTRVLGFNKEKSSLLSKIKKKASIPIITKLSANTLPNDVYASNLYESVITDKYKTPFINERSKSMVF